MQIHPLLFALAVVGLVSINEINANQDYQLTVYGVDKDVHICTKDKASCTKAQEAIKNGNYQICNTLSIKAECIDTPISIHAETFCDPKPNCFSAQSNCINGYNC